MEFKLPARPSNSHKGTFGKVLNIAGSFNYPGAAFLSSVAALKVGCGLVALSTDEFVIKAVAAQTPDVIFIERKNVVSELKNYSAISIGCGLSTDEETVGLFNQIVLLLKELGKPSVIDASGLRILAGLENGCLAPNFVITPHPGEAAYLLREKVETIAENPDFWVKELVKKFGCVCLLKGANTRVCAPNKDIYVNTSGCSALAKAGSGDVLCGMIAGLLAQGVDIFEAAKTAVYLHGKAGEKAAEQQGEHGVLASELLGFI